MNGQDSKQVRYYNEHFALMEMLQEALGGVSANKVLAYLLSHYGYAILSELKGNSLPSKDWGTLPHSRGTLPHPRGNPLNTESPEQTTGNDLTLSEEGQVLPHDWGTLPQKRGSSPHSSAKSDAELAIFDAMNAF